MKVYKIVLLKLELNCVGFLALYGPGAGSLGVKLWFGNCILLPVLIFTCCFMSIFYVLVYFRWMRYLSYFL